MSRDPRQRGHLQEKQPRHGPQPHDHQRHSDANINSARRHVLAQLQDVFSCQLAHNPSLQALGITTPLELFNTWMRAGISQGNNIEIANQRWSVTKEAATGALNLARDGLDPDARMQDGGCFRVNLLSTSNPTRRIAMTHLKPTSPAVFCLLTAAALAVPAAHAQQEPKPGEDGKSKILTDEQIFQSQRFHAGFGL